MFRYGMLEGFDWRIRLNQSAKSLRHLAWLVL